MSAAEQSYEQLQEDATTLPRDLVNAMATRDGDDEGGLTLTKEHIITINKYVNYILALPESQDALERWLGFTVINEPDLMPASWATLFGQMRVHARDWIPLSDCSKKLSSELASTANSINATGEIIIDECKKIRALGSNVKVWDQVVLSKPVPLSVEDGRVVTQLVEYMDVLREIVQEYSERVEQVQTLTGTWRDVIKLNIIPAVAQKNRAIARKIADGELEDLRQELQGLDQEIEVLRKEYDKYIKSVLGTSALGALGLLIGGAIYGAKAEKARKARKKLEGQRRVVARALKARERMEGSLNELDQFVDDLDFRLASVLTAASHLHSAWDTVDSYIIASRLKLEKITDSQKLALFVVYFKQFLGQWSSIEKTSLRLTRIFDEAAAAKSEEIHDA